MVAAHRQSRSWVASASAGVVYCRVAPRSLRAPFFLTVAGVFVAMALVWGFCLPAFEGADEQNHYAFMIFLKDHWRLPRQLPLPSEVTGEGHQPPLYYALGAAWLACFHPDATFVEPPKRPDRYFNRQPIFFAQDNGPYPGAWPSSHSPVHEIRAVQVILPLASLACLWLLLTAIGVDDGAGRAAFALMALNPAWCQLAGALNNDHVAITAFSAALLLMAVIAAEGRCRPWIPPVLGVVLGLGALAKLSVLPLLPMVWVATWLFSKRRARDMAWVTLLPAVLAGWWFARNATMYGDPFGWAMHRLTCSQNLHVKALTDWPWWRFWFLRSFESFWSVFGWMTWRAPLAVTWAFAGFVAAAVLGLFKRGWRELSAGSRRAMLVLAVAAVALVVGVARFNLEFDPPEGRYFYPGLLAWGAGLALGLRPWLVPLGPRAQRTVAWTLAGLLTALNLWLVTAGLLPLYYGY